MSITSSGLPNPYQVPLTNRLTGFSGPAAATVVHVGDPAPPRVIGVEIDRQGIAPTPDDLKVTVKFDPATVSGPSTRPFGFEVRVTAVVPALKSGRVAVDGHDRYTALSDIDADFDIDKESSSSPWSPVTDVEVRVTVELK